MLDPAVKENLLTLKEEQRNRCTTDLAVNAPAHACC